MDIGGGLSGLPVWMLVALGVLTLVQVTVEVIALIMLVRTPTDRVVLGKKWPWVLLIVFVNLIGAIVFLAAGRKPAPAEDPLGTHEAPSAPPHAGSDLADALYGSADGGETPPAKGAAR